MKKALLLAATALALMLGTLALRTRPGDPGTSLRAASAVEAVAGTVEAPPAREDAPPPRPPTASPRELLGRARTILNAYFHRERSALPSDLADPHRYATNLPVGYFQLLVRTFRDEAFEVFSTDYLGNPNRATVAYWALGELARLRHGPTFHLFNAQLEGPDPVRARQAIKALVHYDAPQLAPRILARAPEDPQDADEAELLRTVLWAVSGMRSADAAALDALIDRFEKRSAEEGFPDFYGTVEARRRAAVLRAPDLGAALAEAARLESDCRYDDVERATWAAETAVRHGLRTVAPALRDRIEREIARLRADGREGDLDVLAAERRGEPDVPSLCGLGGREEVRIIAALRRALVDLGGELSPEERRWLDGLRMLRTPREYLIEAGLLAP